jgi:gas vesicle protein
MNNNSKIFLALLAGAAAGAAIGILLSPAKGSEIRDKISDTLDDTLDRISEHSKDVLEELKAKVTEEISKRMPDFSSEKGGQENTSA